MIDKTTDSKPRPNLGTPLVLPCGAVLKNRLAKSAMSDSLGDGEGKPIAAQARLYERWAAGGAALSIIGEVQVDPRFPEKPGNLVTGPHGNLDSMQALVDRATAHGAHLWPQLGHAGALSHADIGPPKGPSPLDMPGLKCDGMTPQDVAALPGMYAQSAEFAKKAGFTGVQIHAGHGFLLSQFLSPLFNHRDDGYGGSITARCRIVLEIIEQVRRFVGPGFPVSIKINSTDKLEGGLNEEDALDAIRLLNQSSIDLIDVSGGTYFPGAKASSEGVSDDGPYFLNFCRRAKEATTIPVMVSGGFKTRAQTVEAISNTTADMVALGRAMVLNPKLAADWISEAGGDPAFPVFASSPPGGVTAWYTMRITALAEDREDTFATTTPDDALRFYEERDAMRSRKWRRKFFSSNEPE